MLLLSLVYLLLFALFGKRKIVFIFISIAAILHAYYYYYSTEHIATEGVVLVTGASSGIGRDASVYLAQHGFHVFAGVRKNDSVVSLLKEAKDKNCEKYMHPIILDVTQSQHIQNAKRDISQFLKESNLHFIGLVNNAGIDLLAPFEYNPLDYVKDLFNTNLFGLMELTQQFIPLLRNSTAHGKTARIIQNSSILGFLTTKYTTGYSASKHALEAISNGLRVELWPWNIQTVVIQPGYIKTQISGNMKQNVNQYGFSNEDKQKEMNTMYPDFIDAYKEQGSKGIETIHTSMAIHDALVSRSPYARYVVSEPVDKYLSLLGVTFLTDYMSDMILYYLY